jgi:Heavy metal binding domain
MPSKSRVVGLSVTVLAFVAAAPAAGPRPPREPTRVRALAILLQVAAGLEESVTSGELGQAHNEGELLYPALSALSLEGSPEQRARLDTLIPGLTRRVADLHAAADAFDRAQARARLGPALQAFEEMVAVFDPDDVERARALAGRFTCPMHPDVVGERNAACPKCGMPLDLRRRVWLGPSPDSSRRPATVTAEICTEEPLRIGLPARGILKLTSLSGEPLELKDLREVHTQKIHLLIVDPSLADYHHEHPVATDVPGEYAFTFTPRVAGAYRAFADLQPLLTGLQEYARADLLAPTVSRAAVQKSYPRSGDASGLHYELWLETDPLKAGEPAMARVRVTRAGRPFTGLEPVMAAFAHLVGFHERGEVVLHMHPIEAQALTAEARGGPELRFQIFAETPGYYRLFLQTQVNGEAQFVPFGVDVLP